MASKPRMPRSILIATPYFSVYENISPQDALTYASALIGDLSELLDKHHATGIPERNPRIIKSAAYAATTSLALIQHALAHLPTASAEPEDAR